MLSSGGKIEMARLSADRHSKFYTKNGGKSGQHREWQSLTATGGDPRESATETKLPLSRGEKVKRAG